MRNVALVLLMVVLGAILHQFLPWWSIWAAGLLVGLFLPPDGLIRAWLIGLIGGALLWGAYAWWLHVQNDGIMAERMGALFGGLSSMALLLVTALFGGVFGGLGTLCSYFAKRLVQRSFTTGSLK